MRLADFILANLEPILQAWEDFARSLPSGKSLTIRALRDDAERMLRFIARDMETRQTPRDQFLKSIGAGPQPHNDDPSAAQDHGLARAMDRFTLSDLVSEYRALRASVLSLWLNAPEADKDMQQVMRFNEAVDQLIAESVDRYSGKLDSDADIFTASIGHDLRNPLNAIAMSAQLLDVSNTISKADKKVVNQITQSALRMSNLIGELQDFSRVRLGGGMLKLECEPLDIALICREVIDEIQASTPESVITLSKTGDTVAIVNGDRIEQLLSNLIGNAVQHGAPDFGIEIAIVGEKRDVFVSVRNMGTAIPLEARSRIFEPLYTREGINDEKRTHLGLGLYIARTIAIAHGGDIAVTSTKETGTTFQVQLPRKPQSASDA